jgi:type II secretion system protein N
MAEETTEEQTRSRRRSALKFLALCLVCGAILAAGALFLLRPYERLEKMIRTVASNNAPPGAAVGDVSVGFPLRVVITDLVAPVPVQGRDREIRIDKLTGSVSALSLLMGKLRFNISSDLLGGTLWMDVSAESPARGRLVFDVRARGVDIGRLSEILGDQSGIRGSGDVDLEGELVGGDPTTLEGRMLAMGRNVSVPRLDLGRVILPANNSAKFTATITAERGTISFDKLEVEGAAYDLYGAGTIRIADPFERSPMDCKFSMVFRQPPILADKRLAGRGSEYLMDAVVESGAEVFFKVSGTVEDPEASLDISSSLGSILKQSSR